jgi:hypothetical protein
MRRIMGGYRARTQKRKEEGMLAARLGGLGIVGIVVVVLIVLAVFYFMRRA